MKIQNNLGVAFLLVLGSLSLTFCTNSKPKENVEEAAVTTETTTTLAQSKDLTFINENGEPVTLSSLKGKTVFINFWATWCPPCIREMPSIDKLKSEFKDNDDIVFMMVDIDNHMPTSSAFMKDNGYDLPVYVPTGNIPSEYLGDAIPTTVILDKEGKIVTRLEGGRDYADPQMIQSLKELVSK